MFDAAAAVTAVQAGDLLVGLQNLLSDELSILNAGPHQVYHTPYINALERLL